MKNYGVDFFRNYSDLLEGISEKSDMQIVIEHVSAVALDEGEQEIQAVVNALRKLGDTGEGQQWAAAQGLNPSDMSDDDIRNQVIAPMGRGAARLARGAQGRVNMGQVKQGINALNTPVIGAFAKGQIAKQVPSGKVRTFGSGNIRPATVDVDVSSGDIDTVMDVLNNLSSEFPRAREMFDQGRFKDALSQVYRRMAKGDADTPQ